MNQAVKHMYICCYITLTLVLRDTFYSVSGTIIVWQQNIGNICMPIQMSQKLNATFQTFKDHTLVYVMRGQIIVGVISSNSSSPVQEYNFFSFSNQGDVYEKQVSARRELTVQYKGFKQFGRLVAEWFVAAFLEIKTMYKSFFHVCTYASKREELFVMEGTEK